MTNELVKTVMNNIVKKNIGDLHENTRISNNEDSYELQKKRSLSNYSNKYKSATSSNYSSKQRERKAVDLNSLAREIKGESNDSKASADFVKKTHKKSGNNRLTLDELSKISGGKENSENKRKIDNIDHERVKSKHGVSLEDLARDAKKNI